MMEYSIVIPTFKRADSLGECLQSVCDLDYPKDRLEVVVIDNGGAQHTRSAAAPFTERLRIRYLVNPINRGYGFSVNRGIVESVGERILLLNDDARPLPDLLRRCDDLLAKDALIGCVGCRVVEQGYQNWGTDVGIIRDDGEVIGNFDVDCGVPIEVDHVYGFCYLFTRESVRRAGVCDRTLFAKPYSSGNRIETDHCLSIRRCGLKVVYDPRMVAVHLAKPRPDMSEVSLRWKRNEIRNTIYLHLKHHGLFGKRAAALRLTFLTDVGLLSAVRHPTRANVTYFLHGVVSRLSAYAHYAMYKCGPNVDTVDAVRAALAADERQMRSSGALESTVASGR
jgi:GT2 family glycosyltransferase